MSQIRWGPPNDATPPGWAWYLTIRTKLKVWKPSPATWMKLELPSPCFNPSPFAFPTRPWELVGKRVGPNCIFLRARNVGSPIPSGTWPTSWPSPTDPTRWFCTFGRKVKSRRTTWESSFSLPFRCSSVLSFFSFIYAEISLFLFFILILVFARIFHSIFIFLFFFFFLLPIIGILGMGNEKIKNTNFNMKTGCYSTKI